MDKVAFELLKSTVAEMDTINTAIQDSYNMGPDIALRSVLGELEFDSLSEPSKSKLTELVNTYLQHVRSVLEGEMESKALDIQQLKSL